MQVLIYKNDCWRCSPIALEQLQHAWDHEDFSAQLAHTLRRRKVFLKIKTTKRTLTVKLTHRVQHSLLMLSPVWISFCGAVRSITVSITLRNQNSIRNTHKWEAFRFVTCSVTKCSPCSSLSSDVYAGWSHTRTRCGRCSTSVVQFWSDWEQVTGVAPSLQVWKSELHQVGDFI